ACLGLRLIEIEDGQTVGVTIVVSRSEDPLLIVAIGDAPAILPRGVFAEVEPDDPLATALLWDVTEMQSLAKTRPVWVAPCWQFGTSRARLDRRAAHAARH